MTLFSFNAGKLFVPWATTDDGVMGGASCSRFVFCPDGFARFTGVVSLENNGGFCSVRSPQLPAAVPDWDAVCVRVRGDGKEYAVGLHTPYQSPGTAYRCRFTPPAGTWADVLLPLDRFVLMRFGTRVGVMPAVPEQIRGVSFLISDKQEGAFTLDVSAVTVTRTDRP